jgi:hypothetical protein
VRIRKAPASRGALRYAYGADSVLVAVRFRRLREGESLLTSEEVTQKIGIKRTGEKKSYEARDVQELAAREISPTIPDFSAAVKGPARGSACFPAPLLADVPECAAELRVVRCRARVCWYCWLEVPPQAIGCWIASPQQLCNPWFSWVPDAGVAGSECRRFPC